MTKFIKLFLAVILLAGCSKKNDESNLTVLTGGGEVSYTVEEAKTVPELEKGLMFRESLAPNAGMIFDLSKVEHTAMWMKNTKIPLDMIFIDGDGVISWIYENAQPESDPDYSCHFLRQPYWKLTPATSKNTASKPATK